MLFQQKVLSHLHSHILLMNNKSKKVFPKTLVSPVASGLINGKTGKIEKTLGITDFTQCYHGFSQEIFLATSINILCRVISWWAFPFHLQRRMFLLSVNINTFAIKCKYTILRHMHGTLTRTLATRNFSAVQFSIWNSNRKCFTEKNYSNYKFMIRNENIRYVFNKPWWATVFYLY